MGAISVGYLQCENTLTEPAERTDNQQRQSWVEVPNIVHGETSVAAENVTHHFTTLNQTNHLTINQLNSEVHYRVCAHWKFSSTCQPDTRCVHQPLLLNHQKSLSRRYFQDDTKTLSLKVGVGLAQSLSLCNQLVQIGRGRLDFNSSLNLLRLLSKALTCNCLRSTLAYEIEMQPGRAPTNTDAAI